MTITFRSYIKFTDFLAGVSSVVSSVLVIIACVMVKYNSIRGMNNMIKILYSTQEINHIKLLTNDLKNSILKLKRSKQIKVIGILILVRERF